MAEFRLFLLVLIVTLCRSSNNVGAYSFAPPAGFAGVLYAPPADSSAKVAAAATESAVNGAKESAIQMPSITVPDMPDMPSISVPDMPDMPSLDGLGGLPMPVVAGIGFVLLAVIASAAAGGGGGDGSGAGSGSRRSRRQASALAIPYDAAARLAYDAWCEENDASFDEGAYAHFRELYNRRAVAEATAKKMARDLAMFENRVPEPPAPRRITTKPRKAKSSWKDKPVPFFAQPA